MTIDSKAARIPRPGWTSPWGFTVALLLVAFTAGAEDLPITGNTGLALDVTCSLPLNFGVISIADGNNAGAVTVAPSLAGDMATSFLVTGHQSGRCDVSNVTSIATIAVSGGGGTWDGAARKLTGATLLMGSDSLEVVIEIDKRTVDVSDSVTSIYIGGTLSVPAHFSAFGTYSQTFTLTVTE
ncbi:DUF4402 domain-containing protein [Montanilutibacter psychrotolerans]|nr:DUF4402 domain-containing protein [Lysobacter psychrotolerans]